MENKENKFHAICYIHKYDLKSDKGGYKKDGSLGSGCETRHNAERSALRSILNKYRYDFLSHNLKPWVIRKGWEKTPEYNEVLAALLDLITWSNDISENSIGYIHEAKANLQENHLMIINRAMGIA